MSSTSSACCCPTPSRRSTAADPRRTVPRDLLAGPTLEAARRLIGTWLVREPGIAEADEPRIGRIVEVEAYIGEADRASHARFGPTGRNAVMYGRPGVAYVYLVYGMYHCLNVVTEAEGRPAAILIRAVEPVSGVEAMRRARAADAGRRRKDPAASGAESARVARLPANRLAAGPGLVAAAFSLTREHTGIDLCDPSSALRLQLGEAFPDRVRIVTSPRVGVDYADEPWTSAPWRFVDAASPALSVPAAPAPRGRGRRRRAPGDR